MYAVSNHRPLDIRESSEHRRDRDATDAFLLDGTIQGAAVGLHGIHPSDTRQGIVSTQGNLQDKGIVRGGGRDRDLG